MVNGPASGGDKTNVPGDWRQQPAFMMRTQDATIHTNTGPGLGLGQLDNVRWALITIHDDQMLPFIQTLLHPTPTTRGGAGAGDHS